MMKQQGFFPFSAECGSIKPAVSPPTLDCSSSYQQLGDFVLLLDRQY
jgi:hypothetical protein